jgi:hypothetical protein
MTTTIEFVWDSSGIADLKTLDRRVRSTLQKAGGDAIRAMKAESSRRVRERKRFRVARVNKALPILYGKLAWRMDVSGKPVPLADFPHRQLKRGVKVQVNQGRWTLVKSAFVATMKSGHLGIFRRRGKARLPIDEAFSTRISDVFRDRDLIPAVQDRAQRVFTSAFTRLLAL